LTPHTIDREAAMPPDYRNSSDHAVTLASGRPLAPGDDGPADLKDPHDKRLIDDGVLVPVEPAEPEPKEQSK
jgi:hypothetical protein